MAKMKIYDIARSLQGKFPELKSKDLIELLNENGFQVKSAQSSIEDEAIGFLMKYYNGKAAGKKTAKPESVKRETAKAAQQDTEVRAAK